MAAHLIREAFALSRRRRVSLRAVFTDVRSAFYSVIRQLVIEMAEPPEYLEQLLLRVSLPDTARSAIAARLLQHPPFALALLTHTL